MINPEIYPIKREFDVAKAVLETKKLAKQIGFSPNIQHQIATVVSELSKNILHHATHGTITLGTVMRGVHHGMEIIAEDEGPGIADVEQALREHYSTRNSLGLGLTAAKRIMDEFSIDTAINQGTTVTTRKWLTHGKN